MSATVKASHLKAAAAWANRSVPSRTNPRVPKSGTQADRDEYGPGGNCVILAKVCMPERQRELEPRPDGPVCTAREPLAAGEAS